MINRYKVSFPGQRYLLEAWCECGHKMVHLTDYSMFATSPYPTCFGCKSQPFCQQVLDLGTILEKQDLEHLIKLHMELQYGQKDVG